jgi:TolA-binding protein
MWQRPVRHQPGRALSISGRFFMRRIGVLLVALLIAAPGPVLAQIESREGIALQNQLLQLRQELDTLRRAGAGAASSALPAPQQAASPRPTGASGDLVQSLLDRVQRMEEEVRAVRGAAEQSEFRERQLRERVQKLEGDLDFRLQQLETQRQGAAPAQPARPAATNAPAQPAATAAGPRPPQRAIAEGQAALGRRDFAAAEAAAREVIASRDASQQVNAQVLLGDALMGRREFSNAAVAYDDARKRSPNGARAPDANVGLANAFIALNSNREACEVLNALRSARPDLGGAVAERAADARRRAQCR